ncbi:trimeric intracellular cation channel family protein [Mesonia sp.]|uniref:trimeric intracellular cation channel family protein n=1 Tax=Mesonia sp. TaxID=1960830 RepID=UPI00175F0A43|nr:trimeric intracellular cation channel family protein [Mesonia sp.]HIB37544.1 trimeric intracellular cation channel family protein [Mesonia sp.]HIO27774.1 trimeric intracellular cation channel family protein [Flavobacteriaceae bacterium]
MDYFLIIDILGVVAFSISGVLSSMKKKMDPFGILIIAFVTSVGGGTLRDILIGFPVAWMRNLTYVYVIIATTIFAIIFRKKLIFLRKSLFLFDTVGIGLYTIIGVEKGLAADFPPIICIAIGTMTACFGGVIRDILCNEIPLLFRTKEIYAIACILGGLTYFILLKLQLSSELVFTISGAVVIIVRSLAVYFDIRLPSVYFNSEEK